MQKKQERRNVLAKGAKEETEARNAIPEPTVCNATEPTASATQAQSLDSKNSTATKCNLPRNDHAITPPDTGRPPLQSSKHIVVCGTHFELSARALIRG
jgi:hypothetical protein